MNKHVIGMLGAEVEVLERNLKLAETTVDYARLFIEVREYLDAIDAQWKRLTALKEKLAYEKIPACLEEEGVKSITLDEGYRIHVSPLVRASCRSMEKAIEWMRENGNDALVKETINASTLAAFAKDLMQREGRELPEDIFNVWIGNNTSLTKL